jgi:hypothetical protein
MYFKIIVAFDTILLLLLLFPRFHIQREMMLCTLYMCMSSILYTYYYACRSCTMDNGDDDAFNQNFCQWIFFLYNVQSNLK